jgi:signal peptidase II
MITNLRQRLLTLFLVAGGVIVVDQLTKLWVVENLRLYETISPIPFLHPFFRITHSYNTGIAFGLWSDNGIFFQFLTSFIMLGLLGYYLLTKYHSLLIRVALSLVIGGGIANVIDRIQHGHVIDFVHFTIGSISNISNIADHAIVIGIIVLLIESIRLEQIEKRNNPEAENKSDF